MPKPTPLLILSDAPGTGLGRIATDLATRTASHMSDTFRVATACPGGIHSRHLTYHQYNLDGVEDFVCTTLPDVWEDFAGREQGVLMTIWDASRLAWLAHPKIQCENVRLRNFLLEKPFKIWGYLPIDAEGVNGKLTYPVKQNLLGFHRLLAYGNWAADVVDRTLDHPVGTTEFLPHGIDSSVFYERNRKMSRKMFISFTQACNIMNALGQRIEDEVLIGIVATNQKRKNWRLGLAVVASLATRYKIRLWIKTDVLERNWSIPALIMDYGLQDQTIMSVDDLSDDDMARAYSACDLTLGIGPEGFGYPIHESLFCGTPCLTGNHAGAPEWMNMPDCLVEPESYDYEGVYVCKRPVFSVEAWVEKAEALIGKRTNHNGNIDWNHVWPYWELWLGNGVR